MTIESRGGACILRPRGPGRAARAPGHAPGCALGRLVRPDPLTDLEADDRLLQGDLRALEIGVCGALAQALQRTVPGPGGPLTVDPLGTLGDLRQDADPVRQ